MTFLHAMAPSQPSKQPASVPGGNSADESTIRMRCAVLSHAHQRIAARITEECVIYDYRRGRKVPIPLWLQEVLAKETEEGDAEKTIWMKRRAELEMQVRELEEGSLLSGKEEDMGSVKKS